MQPTQDLPELQWAEICHILGSLNCEPRVDPAAGPDAANAARPAPAATAAAGCAARDAYGALVAAGGRGAADAVHTADVAGAACSVGLLGYADAFVDSDPAAAVAAAAVDAASAAISSHLEVPIRAEDTASCLMTIHLSSHHH